MSTSDDDDKEDTNLIWHKRNHIWFYADIDLKSASNFIKKCEDIIIDYENS